MEENLNKYTIKGSFLVKHTDHELKYLNNINRPNFAGCYLIKNIVNGKVYVGSAQEIWRRWLAHRGKLVKNNHHCFHLQFAWNKYKPSKFEFTVLEKIEQKEKESYDDFKKRVKEREQYYFEIYDVFNSQKGYNSSRYALSGGWILTEDYIKAGKSANDWENYLVAKNMLINTNLPLTEIAKLSGCSKHLIKCIYERRILQEEFKDIQFPDRNIHIPDTFIGDKLEKFKQLLAEGKTNQEIGKYFNIDKTMVTKIMKINKIKREDIPTAIQERIPVYQYDLEWNFLERYESISSANKKYNISGGKITDCCNGVRKSAAGYKWSYNYIIHKEKTREDKIEFILGKTSRKNHSFIQYDKNMKPIRFFISRRSIDRIGIYGSGSIIADICKNNKNRDFHGYYWKYASDASDKDIEYFYKLKQTNPNSGQLILN